MSEHVRSQGKKISRWRRRSELIFVFSGNKMCPIPFRSDHCFGTIVETGLEGYELGAAARIVYPPVVSHCQPLPTPRESFLANGKHRPRRPSSAHLWSGHSSCDSCFYDQLHGSHKYSRARCCTPYSLDLSCWSEVRIRLASLTEFPLSDSLSRRNATRFSLLLSRLILAKCNNREYCGRDIFLISKAPQKKRWKNKFQLIESRSQDDQVSIPSAALNWFLYVLTEEDFQMDRKDRGRVLLVLLDEE